jgi:hypothetical protein
MIISSSAQKTLIKIFIALALVFVSFLLCFTESAFAGSEGALDSSFSGTVDPLDAAHNASQQGSEGGKGKSSGNPDPASAGGPFVSGTQTMNDYGTLVGINARTGLWGEVLFSDAGSGGPDGSSSGSQVSGGAGASAFSTTFCDGSQPKVRFIFSYTNPWYTCNKVLFIFSPFAEGWAGCNEQRTYDVSAGSNYGWSATFCSGEDIWSCGYALASFSGGFTGPNCAPPPPPPPTASLSANPSTVNRGQQSTLSWTSSNADWCDITNDVGPDIGRVEVNGSKGVTLTETTNYTITCVGAGGTATANATVTVRPLPTVDLQGPNIVELPRTSNIASVNLNWVNANVDSCFASLDWSGDKTPANQGTESLSKPRGNYSFKLSCTGPGCPGTGLCPVSDTQNTRVVEVPQCVFTADPATIPILPATSTLSCDCTHTIAGGGNPCVIDQGIGSVAAVGSLSVRPATATTYTLTCEGPDGSRSFRTSVGVGFTPRLKEVIPRP